MKERIQVIVILALRNLRRHLRRSLLTSIAMIIGGFFLMFSLPLGDGAHEAWIENAVRMGGGHITIQHPDFRSSQKLKDNLSLSALSKVRSLFSRAENIEHVQIVLPQLTVAGLVSSPTGARPAKIMGVDPGTGITFTTLDDKVLEGRYLQPDDRLAAYVGVGLTKSLSLKLGSRFVVTSQDATGDISGQLLRVVGIFQSGVPEVDEGLIHIPMATAQDWLYTNGGVTKIALLLDNSEHVNLLVRDLDLALSELIDSATLEVVGWRESMPALEAVVALDEFGNYLFQGILFGIIALGIVNTILMSVLHRYREFGVLQAIGLSPSQTGSLVFTEGVILTVLSGIIGIGLGLFVTWFFWRNGLDISGMMTSDFDFSGVVMDPVIVPVFQFKRFVQALLFILSVGVLASLYPAYRAAHVNVAEAMKFER